LPLYDDTRHPDEATEDALIRRLSAEGEPKAKIAARLGISRTTVIKSVASESPPQCERKAAVASFTPWAAAEISDSGFG
jgi:hypothetical protein